MLSLHDDRMTAGLEVDCFPHRKGENPVLLNSRVRLCRTPNAPINHYKTSSYLAYSFLRNMAAFLSILYLYHFQNILYKNEERRKSFKRQQGNRGDMRKIHVTRQFFEASGRHWDFFEITKKNVFR